MSYSSFHPRGQFGFNVTDPNGIDRTAQLSRMRPDDEGFVWGKNRVVSQGLNHFLNVGLRGEGVIATFYLAPFAANVTPAANVTAATFASTLSEFTSYAESTRQVWTPDGPSTAQTLVNSVAPALFTVNGDGQTTIYGGGLLSTQAKEATTGICVAAGRLPNGLTGLAEGYEVRLRYRINGASS